MHIRAGTYRLLLSLRGRSKQQSLFENLRQRERASPTEIEQMQEQLLSQLLHHAYSQVPYYRRVIDELGGIEFLSETKPAMVLNKLPLLTKGTIRENWQDLKSLDLMQRKWYYNTSGGSTGEPVKLIQDQRYFLHAQSVKILFDSWTGHSMCMPKVCLWGSERDLLVGKESARTRVMRCLRNEFWLNAFRMTEHDMIEHVQTINRVRPVQILAYVDCIYELSRFIERERLNIYSPKSIMTSAGTLYPHMRETIERVFKAKVFNRYGSREVGDIACECEVHRGLHVSPLTHYVEILREDGTPTMPGEFGEVVVTSLVNYSMPLIRYRIGDVAVWANEGCSCGKTWPLLKNVMGRTMDVFTKRNGTKIVPEYFIHIIGVVLNPPWLRKFQVIQEDYDHICLMIVPAIDKERARREIETDMPDLMQKVRRVMGEECRLEVEMVDDIPPSPSGKYRYTISKVSAVE